MTEQEWLQATDPKPMLEYLQEKASNRKLLLFACGCGRRYCCYWHDIPEKPLIDRHCREFIDTTERVIDGVSASEELETARAEITFQLTQGVPWPLGLQWGLDAISRGNWGWWVRQHEDTAWTAQEEASMDEAELLKGYEERHFQSDLLRDLFGPLPFREVRVDPAWLSWNGGTVKRLTEGIYDERAFDRMLILADLLEEAGCKNQDILAHCRSRGEHVRGCWVVDLVLGKS